MEQKPQPEAHLEIDAVGSFAVNGTVTVGRAPGCDVVVNARSVSRQHAQIFLEGNRFCIKDLGSANGTYVNDSKVTLQLLSDGDIVCFGEVRSVFRMSATSIGANTQATAETQLVTGRDLESDIPAAGEEDLRIKIRDLEAENERLKKLVAQLERVLADSNVRIRNLQERLNRPQPDQKRL